MKIICGLGNPGTEYKDTRHNVGFMAVDRFADKINEIEWEMKFDARTAKLVFKNEDVLLLKPQTYMNLSGKAVAKALGFYKVDPKDVLVIHDDCDLPLGRVMLKKDGGDAGHHGVASVISAVGKDFHRIRIGIGRVSGEGLTEWVLSPFSESEKTVISDALDMAVFGIEIWISQGLEKAQQRVNRRARQSYPCPEIKIAQGPDVQKEVLC